MHWSPIEPHRLFRWTRYFSSTNLLQLSSRALIWRCFCNIERSKFILHPKMVAIHILQHWERIPKLCFPDFKIQEAWNEFIYHDVVSNWTSQVYQNQGTFFPSNFLQLSTESLLEDVLGFMKISESVNVSDIFHCDSVFFKTYLCGFAPDKIYINITGKKVNLDVWRKYLLSKSSLSIEIYNIGQVACTSLHFKSKYSLA